VSATTPAVAGLPTWDYSGLGPFTFERGDHQRAVEEVVDRLATSK
jgi:hypothetical protein